ncbi:hypothetical protein T05_12983 [Trichinella murrelli]|uniref:Uncharacterized protein n=1 Tax=Trichinella murrelli TaxID=144512 RepID=A0A0V0T7C1_9BILA|nr:hypothetical protein T05_12983 [Trichinella murrelli]
MASTDWPLTVPTEGAYVELQRPLGETDQPRRSQGSHKLQSREAQTFYGGDSGLRGHQIDQSGSGRGFHPQVDHRPVCPFGRVAEGVELDLLRLVQGHRHQGTRGRSSSSLFRSIQGLFTSSGSGSSQPAPVSHNDWKRIFASTRNKARHPIESKMPAAVLSICRFVSPAAKRVPSGATNVRLSSSRCQ